jgi:hypothetical protein
MSKPKTVTKIVEKKEELFVQFSQEEMSILGMAPGDKFELLLDDPTRGSITLKKMVPMELDLDTLDKSILVSLIQESVTRQVPVDDIIRDALVSAVQEAHTMPSEETP